MQEHAIKHNLSEKPRKLLVGGMKAEKMLLATPLLKWYLEHGMLVTKIHQVVEFQPMKCFQNFVKDVTDARRAGDLDPDKSIMADLSKLIGNSGYGSTLLNKLNHTNISYCGSENEACLKANDPKFKALTQLNPDYAYYEVESMKKKIILDIPIQIGYFILQYAKLRMLEFYYDFLDVYVSRENFQMVEMDTDSSYKMIAGDTLDEIIRPEYKAKFRKSVYGHGCRFRGGWGGYIPPTF